VADASSARDVRQAVLHLMSEALREELIDLARSGQATALRDALRAARCANPALTPILSALQACTERFDFDAVIELLPEPDDDPR
jgi:hypothetical protein